MIIIDCIRCGEGIIGDLVDRDYRDICHSCNLRKLDEVDKIESAVDSAWERNRARSEY